MTALADRVARAVCATLPDATVLVHGSRALGDARPDSDLDVLVLSDLEPDERFVAAIVGAWDRDPTIVDLDLVRYETARRPTREPQLELYLRLDRENGDSVVDDRPARDLIVVFSLCNQLGYPDVGHVPPEWVDAVGQAQLDDWRRLPFEFEYARLMAYTACRVWRFREERIHCSKTAAARWAEERGARVAFDEESVRALVDRVSSG
jgi:predicted nucleotidyltransferase